MSLHDPIYLTWTNEVKDLIIKIYSPYKITFYECIKEIRVTFYIDDILLEDRRLCRNTYEIYDILSNAHIPQQSNYIKRRILPDGLLCTYKSWTNNSINHQTKICITIVFNNICDIAYIDSSGNRKIYPNNETISENFIIECSLIEAHNDDANFKTKRLKTS